MLHILLLKFYFIPLLRYFYITAHQDVFVYISVWLVLCWTISGYLDATLIATTVSKVLLLRHFSSFVCGSTYECVRTGDQ